MAASAAGMAIVVSSETGSSYAYSPGAAMALDSDTAVGVVPDTAMMLTSGCAPSAGVPAVAIVQSASGRVHEHALRRSS